MGDRQGRPSDVNLCPFVGVDLNLWPTVCVYSRHRADTDVKWIISWSIQIFFCHSSSQEIKSWQRRPIQLQIIFFSYLNLLSVLLRTALLRISLQIISFQSAYTKHHSTESTLLAVHDHIIKSMSEQTVFALCLLDLSAAFDGLLLIILFSFIASLLGLVLMAQWFLGLLLIYHFGALLFLSTIFPQLILPFVTVFHKDQSLVLLFILYSTPLSSFISDSFVGHHLFADDTQLFISFRAPELAANILHLTDAIDFLPQWMSAISSLTQSI